MGESLDVGPRVGCRAGRSTPARDSSLLLIVAFVAFVVGYFATDRFIHTRSVAAEFTPVSEEFGLWTSVLDMVGGFAVASLVYCVATGIGVGHLFTRLRARTVALTVVVAVAPLTGIFAALILGLTSVPESVDKRLAEATRPFVLTAGACTVPGLAGLLLIRAIARRDDEWREGGPARWPLCCDCAPSFAVSSGCSGRSSLCSLSRPGCAGGPS